MRFRSGKAIAMALVGLAVLAGCAAPTTIDARNKPVLRSQTPQVATITLRCGAKPLKLTLAPMDRALLRLAPPHAVLAPTDVTAALVCHYAGLNAHRPPGSLLGSTTVKDPKHLAVLLNDLTRVKPWKGGRSCPMDDGTYEQLLFSSPSAGLVYVLVPRNGCAFVGSSLTAGAWNKSSALWDAMATLDVGYPAP